MDYLSLCITARLLKADLELADRELRIEDRSGEHTLILIKQSLICIKNLADLLDEYSLIYREFPNLASIRKLLLKDFEFCAYIRSRYVGHLKKIGIDKAIEWKPELRYAIYDEKDVASNFINLCVLETIINTYVDKLGKHKVFEGDTDLSYPPDMQRFLNFLEKVLDGGQEILRQINSICLSKLSTPPELGSKEALDLFIRAGQTEFGFIK